MLDNNLFFPEKVYFEDNAIALCVFLLAENIQIVYNKEPVYFYRQNPESIIHTFNIQKLQDRLDTAVMLLENAKSYGLYNIYKDKFDRAFYNLYYKGTILNLLGDKQFKNRIKTIRLVYDGYIQQTGYPPNKIVSAKNDFWEIMVQLVGKYPSLVLFYDKIQKINTLRHSIMKNK